MFPSGLYLELLPLFKGRYGVSITNIPLHPPADRFRAVKVACISVNGIHSALLLGIMGGHAMAPRRRGTLRPGNSQPTDPPQIETGLGRRTERELRLQGRSDPDRPPSY